jgi:hypothetical protein
VGTETAALRIVVASLLALLAGWPALRISSARLSLRIVLAVMSGASLCSVAAALMSRAGVAASAFTFGLYALALGTTWRYVSPPDGSATVPRPTLHWSDLAPVLAMGVVVWKVWRVPLWSWDHFAIWGFKARKIAVTGGVDLSFLQLPSSVMAHTEYPLGFPFLANFFALGSVPGAADFKLQHIIFLVAILLLVRGSVALWTDSALMGNAVAAATVLLPTFWDTEVMGLADTPLAVVAAAAAALLMIPSGLANLLLACCAGFLPWLKMEGIPLGFLFAAAAVASGHARGEVRRHAFIPLLGWAAGLATMSGMPTAGGDGFLAGAWMERLQSRTIEPSQILSPFLSELAASYWFGLWLLVPLGVLVAVARRRPDAFLVLAVVSMQLAIYVLVYFATHLEPAEHIRSSLLRLAAALAPAAVVGLVHATTGRVVAEPIAPTLRGDIGSAPV